jgi:hypothetical protein
MNANNMIKRRGFVMTGGGAKGLYEAGVIHAFHLTGMEFDVITGSSIGAFNSVFYAEYLLKKNQLPDDVKSDPGQAVEAMDSLVKAFHHAWLRLPDQKIIDDSEDGPLGKLKDDLLKFNISLPDLTRIYWWWTDPDRSAIPSPGVWPSVAKIFSELVERLGSASALLDILKNHRDAPFEKAIRTYLARFDMEKSLVPPGDDKKLTSVFTEPIAPLRLEHLLGKSTAGNDSHSERVVIVNPGRTMRDYAQEGIDVRLTRANYRTGRLEISSYFSIEDFVAYLLKQAFRIEMADPEKIPLGSFRLHLPGNPDAINAALASGRFPGVLAPYPIKDIYLEENGENELLHKLLTNWFNDPEVKAKMAEAYHTMNPDQEESDSKWEKTYSRWKNSSSMRTFFPQINDIYVDGGAIDNTPSNTAIDATREWADESGKSKREIVLDLYTIFLHTEPKIEQTEIEDQAAHQVVQRTLEIQGAAKQTNDAVVVDTINTYGRRAERLGDTLSVVLSSLKDSLNSVDEGNKRQIFDSLREKSKEHKLRINLGQNDEDVLDRIDDWAENMVNNRLPLQVNEVIVYPDKMPLSTLQFTERLGYRQENAINMLTMGCYQTLWALRGHLEDNKKNLDAQDQMALELTKKWMGIEELPDENEEREELRQSWSCQRTECVFHRQHCSHGAR